MDMLKNILRNNRLNVVLLLIDIIVILVLLLFYINIKGKDTANIVSNTSKVEEKAEEYKNNSDSLIDSYNAILVGNTYYCGDKYFSFGYNNDYYGYFDANHTSVEEYLYLLIPEGMDIVLRIYSPDNVFAVSYYIDINADGGFDLRPLLSPDETITIN